MQILFLYYKSWPEPDKSIQFGFREKSGPFTPPRDFSGGSLPPPPGPGEIPWMGKGWGFVVKKQANYLYLNCFN